MFEAILKDFAWASMLLLIGLFLRSRVKVFQKLFIPVAVIAGLVGLVLGSEILGKFCPVYIHWSDNVSSFANPLLAILFVAMAAAYYFVVVPLTETVEEVVTEIMEAARG